MRVRLRPCRFEVASSTSTCRSTAPVTRTAPSAEPRSHRRPSGGRSISSSPASSAAPSRACPTPRTGRAWSRSGAAARTEPSRSGTTAYTHSSRSRPARGRPLAGGHGGHGAHRRGEGGARLLRLELPDRAAATHLDRQRGRAGLAEGDSRSRQWGTPSQVFDHVTIRVSDREASERFYETVLTAIAIEKSVSDEHFVEWGDFSLAAASEGKPPTRRLHLGFWHPRVRLSTSSGPSA